MKKGTFILNPYVKPYFNGKPNPNYKSMYLCKSGANAKCLAYTGEVILYPYKDVVTWETDGQANCKEILNDMFAIKNDKWYASLDAYIVPAAENEVMGHCSNCGSMLPGNAKWCMWCGKKISNTVLERASADDFKEF